MNEDINITENNIIFYEDENVWLNTNTDIFIAIFNKGICSLASI